MNRETIGEWMLEHPKATRVLGLGLVAFGTWSYLGLLRKHVELEHVLAVARSEAARAASEALGG